MKRVVKLLISLMFLILVKGVGLILAFLRGRGIRSYVILYYHGVPGEQRRRFADQMDEVLRLCRPVALPRDGVEEEGRRLVAITFDDAFETVFENALPELASRRIPCAIFVPTAHLGLRPAWISDPGHEAARERVASPDRLRALSDDLVTIGSHTVSHANLALLSEAEMRQEISESKRTLEEMTGRRVDYLAFPYGEWTALAAECAKTIGYRAVFSTIPRWQRRDADRFVWERVSVSPLDWKLEFRLKLVGAYSWLHLAVSVKRELRRILAPFGKRRGLNASCDRRVTPMERGVTPEARGGRES